MRVLPVKVSWRKQVSLFFLFSKTVLSSYIGFHTGCKVDILCDIKKDSIIYFLCSKVSLIITT